MRVVRVCRAFGSAEECHLDLRPMVSYHVVAPAGSDLLAKDESYPRLTAVGSAQVRRLNPLVTVGNAATAPAPTDI